MYSSIFFYKKSCYFSRFVFLNIKSDYKIAKLSVCSYETVFNKS